MSDQLKPIDVTKPIETNCENPTRLTLVTTTDHTIFLRQSNANRALTFDRFGRQVEFECFGPMIRNIVPTDAEIVAERLAKAATRPMKPTGLVTKGGVVVEMVEKKTHYPEYPYTVAIRHSEYGIFTYTVTADGEQNRCTKSNPNNLLPAKDFCDE